MTPCPVPSGTSSQSGGCAPGSRHPGSPGIVPIVSALPLSPIPAPPAPEMGASCPEGRRMAAALIRALTTASLTGLPTPGSEGEFDTKLKIAAVLFLCWRGGAGRGAPAPLNDLPTKNKAFSLHLLCSCCPPPRLPEMEPEWWSCWRARALAQTLSGHPRPQAGLMQRCGQ